MKYGPVHKLIIYDVGSIELDKFGYPIGEFEDFEIEHPDTCIYDPVNYFHTNCQIDWEMNNVGFRYSLHYSGARITEPGEYRIQAWNETIRYFEGEEHDGGIGLIEGEPLTDDPT